MQENYRTRNAISAFNAVIREAAQLRGLAYADVNLWLKQAEQGLPSMRKPDIRASYLVGVFSDGLHLNARQCHRCQLSLMLLMPVWC